MTTPNAAQLAAFCVDVYDAATDLGREIPTGFVRLTGFSGENGDGGLFAAAYLDTETGQLVLAFRGDDALRDLFTNLSFVASTGDTLFNRALALVDEARKLAAERYGVAPPDAAVTLTGHGVGGGFASLVSVATGLQAATFNAVGISGLLSAFEERFGPLAPDFASRISNYVAQGDETYALPRGTSQVGQVIDVQTSTLSFFGQLSTAVGADMQGQQLLDAIYDWLGTGSADRRNAQRVLMALELQFGAVTGDAAATDAQKAELNGRLNELLQTDSADRIAARKFDRVMIDGSDAGQAQDAGGYGASNDLIVGASGADALHGGAGDDMLLGGDGNDILAGGAGADELHGGKGSDVYRFASADGTNVLRDAQGTNRVIVDGVPVAGFFYGDGSGIWRSADGGLTLTDTETGATLATASGLALELDGFAEGHFGLLRVAQFLDPASLPRVAGDLVGASGDELVGSAGAELIEAGEGDDYVMAGAGDDVAAGGTGNDVLAGGDGSDRLAADKWVSTEEALANPAPGASGAGDWLAGGEGDDVLVGGARGDVLSGGGGRDLLIGGGGGDFLLGDADYLPAETQWTFAVGADGRSNYYSWSDPGSNDPAASAADLMFGGDGNDWMAGGRGDDTLFGGAGDDELIGNAGADTLFGGAGRDRLYGGERARGAALDFSDDYLDGGDDDDMLAGSAGNNFLLGGGGNDDIRAGAGENLIEGGDGDDTISATGRDVVYGGAGNDLIVTFGIGDARLDGGEGDDRLFGEQGNDTLAGGAGDDRLYGGEGDDVLDGGAGDDRYVFDAGSGLDAISDASGFDVIELRSIEGAGATDYTIARGGIRLVADNTEIRLEYGALGDRILLGRDPRGVIEQVDLTRFAGGTVTTESIALTDLPVVYAGTDDSEILFGVEGFRNVVSGGGGNDIVVGASGADVIAGGAGLDVLRGGDGGDTYVFGIGDGLDTIDDTGAGGVDVLSLGSALDAATLTLAGGLLFLDIGGGEGVKLAGFDRLDAYGSVSVERFEFGGGIGLSAGELIDRGFDLRGTTAAESVSGTNAVDRFHASAGDDRLAGGEGDDVYEFGRGSGKDFISDLDLTPGNFDRVVLRDGITPDDLQVSAEVDRLTLRLSGADQLSIQWLPAAGYQIESIAFGDGTLWDLPVLQGFFQASNRPPGLLAPIGDQTAREDAPFVFQVPAGTFEDPDGEGALAYSASLEDGSSLPAWLAFDGATGTFSGTPLNADVGSISVTVTAADGSGERVADTFAIDVRNVNDAPALAAPLGVLNVAEDSPLDFAIPAGTFVDVDRDDALRYVAALENGAALPDWLHFDAAAGTLRGSPGNSEVGSYRVRVAALDAAGAYAEDVLALNVLNVNDAPTLAAPLADAIVKESHPLDLLIDAGAFVDVDPGDALEYALTLSSGDAPPEWLTFDGAELWLGGTPGRADIGTLELRLTATDGAGASVYDDFLVTVAAVPGLVLIGTNADDDLFGDAGDDTLAGRGGRDLLAGSAGDDTFAFARDAIWSGTARREHPDTGERVGLAGRGRSYDVFDGGAGSDALLGTGRADAILRFDPSDLPGAAERITGIERIDAGGGSDIVDLTGPTSYGPVTVLGGAGHDVVWSSDGDDLLYGGSGMDRIDGGGGNDYIAGGGGGDVLSGGSGNDILEGDSGIDWLYDYEGSNVLWGRGGADSLYDGGGSALLVGGAGVDRITLGGGRDVIAFNRGDGRDVVRGSGAATLSLGGGIRYEDLALRKRFDDLIVETGGGERITFQGWYADPLAQSVLDMQVITQVMQGAGPGSDAVLGDQPVEAFDFRAIVAAFDEARAMSRNLVRWEMLDALARAEPRGFDNLAAGGDLAYQYGLSGTLAGIGVGAAQAVLSDSRFGSGPQPLSGLDALTAGTAKLGGG